MVSLRIYVWSVVVALIVGGAVTWVAVGLARTRVVPDCPYCDRPATDDMVTAHHSCITKISAAPESEHLKSMEREQWRLASETNLRTGATSGSAWPSGTALTRTAAGR